MMWYSASELVGLPGIPGTVQRINSRAKSEGWDAQKRQGRGGGNEYNLKSLPPTTQAALLRKSSPKSPAPQAGGSHTTKRGVTAPVATGANASLTPADATAILAAPSSPLTADGVALFEYDPDALWSHYERKPQGQKDKARAKLDAINTALTLIGNGIAKSQAWEEAASAHNTHRATLYRWYSSICCYDRSDWLAALVPGYTGRTATAECSPEAWDYFKADYLRLSGPAAAAVYDRLQRAAKEHNWQIPSLRTLERKLERELPRASIILAREGVEALKRSYPSQVRDKSVFHALESVNSDGHKFDVFIKWPDGEIGRPCLVGWQDIYSGKLLSYRVDKTENADSVRLSFGDLVEQYGIPSSTYLDNGRGFAAKWLTGGTPTRYRFKIREEDPAGILTILGVKIHWATPYHGQSKPIERAWRDLCEYVAKHPAFTGAYTGNKPTAKPEDYGTRAIPLDEFMAVLKTEIAAHNARQGRRATICAGRSFDVTFAESYERSAIRKATAEQRRLWLLAAEGVKVQANGIITLKADKDNRYWSNELHDHAGHNVVVRFDPQDLHSLVHVYTLDGRYIGEATCETAKGFNDTMAAREHNRARKLFHRAAKQQLEAGRRMDVLTAAKLLPVIQDAPTPNSNIVRPFRPAVDLRNGTPTHAPLSAADKAAVVEFQNNFQQPAPVAQSDDPHRRFERWQRLDARKQAGEQLSETDARWHQRYPESDEYKSMKEFFDDFAGFGIGG